MMQANSMLIPGRTTHTEDSMLRLHTLALACAPLLLSATGAGAAIIHLNATLTNTQEVGGTPPAATTPFTEGPGLGGDARPVSSGTAHFVLDTTLNFMTMTVTVFEIDVTGTQTAYLNDDLVNAHIHAPAPPGSNASVRWGFFGAPDH